MEQKFSVTGMSCSACSASVEKAVAKVEGVVSGDVNLLANTMKVSYDETKTNNQEIMQAVIDAGYGVSIFSKTIEVEQDKKINHFEAEAKNMKTRLLVSAIFLLPLMYISMGHMFHWPLPAFFLGSKNAMTFALTQFLLTLPVLFVNRKYYEIGFKALWKRSPNMDSLIAIGSSSAMFYGIFVMYRLSVVLGQGDLDMAMHYGMSLYFESAATILTLITLGKYLETRSKGKTSDAITKLLNLAPKTAIVIRNGVEIEIPNEEVHPGDIVVIRPGTSIPIDGVVVDGSSSIDQSALTGESIPVEKQIGDDVMAGSMNKNGFLKVEAKKVGDDTTLAQIIDLVEEASASKAPIAQLADKVSGVFVPIVMGIAVLSMVVWLVLGQTFEFSLSIGIAVLVISCPCALGLATPVAIMVGTGVGASNGILIKSAEALETAHNVNAIVLDKTGTITEGKPKVTDIVPADGISDQELLAIAGSIEKPSEHPLSDTIVEHAQEKKIDFVEVDEFQAIAGRGILGKIDGEQYYAGNRQWMIESNIAIDGWEKKARKLSEEGKTPLYFAKNKKFLGLIAVADTIKPTSKRAIDEMKAMNLDITMLTGDNLQTAEAIRKDLAIDHVIADVMPQDKEREIRRLQAKGEKVAMVGDGINDAPALVRADVGIAIGAGTDIAIESADIVLMKGDLMEVVTAIQISRATMRNIKQNLFWAFIYNIIGIPIAAGVFYGVFGWKLNPMFAAAAMSLSSVSVVSNALRLRFFKPKFHGGQEQ